MDLGVGGSNGAGVYTSGRVSLGTTNLIETNAVKINGQNWASAAMANNSAATDAAGAVATAINLNTHLHGARATAFNKIVGAEMGDDFVMTASFTITAGDSSAVTIAVQSSMEELAVEISEQQASKMKSEASLTKVNRRIGASSIVSPDDGIITSLDVTTPGQVIGSGQILATLVPITDELIIEAQLPPADINYISLGQKANIMITAYDVRTYGKLIGEVSKIGANTILNEQDGMSYYPIEIIIRDKTFDMAKDTEAEFIPGMEASVELVGEKRSIAAYLTKPFSQFKSEAFREK